MIEEKGRRTLDMARPYQQAGLVVGKDITVAADIVRALQTDLRALGYQRAGIDGQFGDVSRLRYVRSVGT